MKQAGEGGIEVRVQDRTIWLCQKPMATLFDCSVDNISLHLKSIYEENQLLESVTTEDFSVVQQEDSRKVQRIIKHYNTILRDKKFLIIIPPSGVSIDSG